MIVLLPPSETKVSGGGSSFHPASLRFPALTELRERMIDALVALAADDERAARVLKVGPKARHEIAANASLREAPAMPAISRYTGVLFDALGAATLDTDARRWVDDHVMIHSAPFGPVGAADEIPIYRLSATSSVPGIGSQPRFWAEHTSRELQATGRLVLDLRSKAYRLLGPVPGAIVPEVVTETADGRVRALNHFNKRSKGHLVRALALARPDIVRFDDLMRWSDAANAGLRVREGVVELVASN